MTNSILIILTLAGFASGAEFEVTDMLSVVSTAVFSGSVGIGTSAVSRTRLAVIASTASAYALAVGTSVAYGFVVSTAGTVGIAGEIKIGSTTLACTPANAGSIRWDGADFSGCNGFTWSRLDYVSPPPTISTVTPSTGYTSGNTAITISGNYFSPLAAVSIGTATASNVSVVSASTITATTPPGAAGATDVKVVNYNGQTGTKAGGFTYTASPCSDGWVLVPDNATYGTSDFCVMKYEAKNVSGSAQSVAAGTPWVSISQINAIGACSAIVGGAHLLSWGEAQTINRNIENVGSNWSSGTSGSGCLYGGHVDDNTGALAASDDSNPYYGTDGTAGDNFTCPFPSTSGLGNRREERRTFTLSNGEVIWDWSGNVYEWLAGTCKQSDWYNSGTFIEWSNSNLDNYERPTLGPSNSGWTSSQGTGEYYGCAAEGDGVIRGGRWGDGDVAYAGVFAFHAAYSTSDVRDFIGFRCGKSP